ELDRLRHENQDSIRKIAQLQREIEKLESLMRNEVERTRVFLERIPQMQVPVESKTVEATTSIPDTVSAKLNGKPSIKRRITWTILLVGAIIAIVLWMMNTPKTPAPDYRAASPKDVPVDDLVKAYDTRLPPSTRLGYLTTLYASKRRNFD